MARAWLKDRSDATVFSLGASRESTVTGKNLVAPPEKEAAKQRAVLGTTGTRRVDLPCEFDV